MNNPTLAQIIGALHEQRKAAPTKLNAHLDQFTSATREWTKVIDLPITSDVVSGGAAALALVVQQVEQALAATGSPILPADWMIAVLVDTLLAWIALDGGQDDVLKGLDFDPEAEAK